VNADELDFCIENSESRALIYQDVSDGAVAASARASEMAASPRPFLFCRNGPKLTP